MAGRNTADGPLALCPCGCGIPVTTKKGIRYRDAKDREQLKRHFVAMDKRNKNKFARVVK